MNNSRARAEAVLNGLKRLPAMPAPVLRVIQLAGDPNSAAGEIAECISTEPSLTTDVLRVANSAYYGVPGEVTNVRMGVIMLGTTTIRSLAMMAAAYTWFEQPELCGRRGRAMWDHALSTAIFAGALARRYAPTVEEEAFCCGLLHDLGKIILTVSLTSQYEAILERAHARRLPDAEAERAALGFDHSDVGDILAERWGLPAMLREVVRHHHNPRDAQEHRAFAEFVHAGDYLYWRMAEGEAFDPSRRAVEPEVARKFELDNQERIEALFETANAKREALSSLLKAA
ncbi:MAG: HDOD domain-containing protein [Armatimonadota bacterium]